MPLGSYMNKLLFFVLICSALLIGCKKGSSVTPIILPGELQSTIQATGGVNQTDTIGRTLVNNIVIKINEPGSALNKFFVQIFQTTLCNGDSVVERTVSNLSSVSYTWKLSSKVGIQTLKFKILNDARNIVDSINVTATGIPPAHGWHTSSCLVQKSLTVAAFAKLKNGRLLAGFSGAFNPCYSDDNGITWHQIKSFYMGYYPWAQQIVVLPTDEIFIASAADGIYYSADGGTSWSSRSRGLPFSAFSMDLYYTSTGSFVYTTHGGGIFTSDDKGLTWSTISTYSSNSSLQYRYLGALSNGDVYFTRSDNFTQIIVKLDHVTKTLISLTNPIPFPPQYFTTPFMDKDSYTIYWPGYNPSTANDEIYQSTDLGVTWTKVFSNKSYNGGFFTGIGNFTKQSDGNCYFQEFGWGYYKTADFKSFQNISSSPVAPNYEHTYPGGTYILASNNNYVLNLNGIVYYVP
jgi:hypothetical protein